MSLFINNGLFFIKNNYIKCKSISKNEGLKRLSNSVKYDRGVL